MLNAQRDSHPLRMPFARVALYDDAVQSESNRSDYHAYEWEFGWRDS